MKLIIKVKPLPKKRLMPARNSMRVTVEPTKFYMGLQQDNMGAWNAEVKLIASLKRIFKGQPNYKIQRIPLREDHLNEDAFTFLLIYPTDKLGETEKIVSKEAEKLGVWNNR
jgi:hypothetical protein